MSDHIDTIPLMKWEAEQKGYTCNDCYLSMQNCHDMSICCEDETGLCDNFEEMPQEADHVKTVTTKIVANGNCCVCGKPLDSGLFLCEKCAAHTGDRP